MFTVKNISAAEWHVIDEDGEIVATMKQGFDQSWRAWDWQTGEKLMIGEDFNYGGSKRPYEIANELLEV